jgi:hypothetical protein
VVNELVLNGIYQHYKGNQYLVRDLVRHSETLEWLVFYECLYDNPAGKLWVRPKDMFLEHVTIEGKTIPRFKFITAALEV